MSGGDDGGKVAPAPAAPSTGGVGGGGGTIAATSAAALAKLPPDSLIPHDHDVLCGRGGSINTHPGNERFRTLVEKRKRVYLTARFKREKRLIASSIVKDIRTLDPPGRFLAKDPKTDGWYDIGDEKARDKTSQALRENAPTIRKEIDKENDAKREAQRREEEEEARRRAAADAAHHHHRHYGYPPPPPGHPGAAYPYPPHPHAPPPGHPGAPPPPPYDYYHEHGRYAPPHPQAPHGAPPPPPYYDPAYGPPPPPPPQHGHYPPPPPYYNGHPPPPYHYGSPPSPPPREHPDDGRPRTPTRRYDDGRAKTPEGRPGARSRTPDRHHQRYDQDLCDDGSSSRSRLSGGEASKASAFESIPKSFADASKSVAEASASLAETIKSNIPATFSFGTSLGDVPEGGRRPGDGQGGPPANSAPPAIRKPHPQYATRPRDENDEDRHRFVHFQSPEKSGDEQEVDAEVGQYYDDAARRGGRRYPQSRPRRDQDPRYYDDDRSRHSDDRSRHSDDRSRHSDDRSRHSHDARPTYSPLPVSRRHQQLQQQQQQQGGGGGSMDMDEYYGVPPSPSHRSVDTTSVSEPVFHRIANQGENMSSSHSGSGESRPSASSSSSSSHRRRYPDETNNKRLRSASPYGGSMSGSRASNASPLPYQSSPHSSGRDPKRRTTTSPYPYQPTPPQDVPPAAAASRKQQQQQAQDDSNTMGGQSSQSSTKQMMSQFAQHMLTSWDSYSIVTRGSKEEKDGVVKPSSQGSMDDSKPSAYRAGDSRAYRAGDSPGTASRQQQFQQQAAPPTQAQQADSDPEEMGQEVLLEMDSMDLDDDELGDDVGAMPPPQPVPSAAAYQQRWGGPGYGPPGNMSTAPTPPVNNRDSEVRTPPPQDSDNDDDPDDPRVHPYGDPRQQQQQQQQVEIDWPSRVGGLNCHSWIKDSIKENIRETKNSLLFNGQQGQAGQQQQQAQQGQGQGAGTRSGSAGSITTGGGSRSNSRAGSLTLSPQLSLDFDGMSLTGTEYTGGGNQSLAGSVGGASLVGVFDGELNAGGPIPALPDLAHGGGMPTLRRRSSGGLRGGVAARRGPPGRSPAASPLHMMMDEDQSLVSKTASEDTANKSLASLLTKGSSSRSKSSSNRSRASTHSSHAQAMAAARFGGGAGSPLPPGANMNYSMESQAAAQFSAAGQANAAAAAEGTAAGGEKFVWAWDGKSKTSE